VPTKDQDLANLLQEMQRLGLEPAGLKRFTESLHKLAIASAVSPANLTMIIREVSALCEGKEISLSQARDYIQQLADRQKTLQKAIEGLEKKEKSLEVELSLKELDYTTTKANLSEFARIRQELQEYNLSFADISKLLKLINAASQLGYNSSPIIDVLSDLKTKEGKRKEIDAEIESLLNSKRTLQDKLLALEQEVFDRQQMLKAAENLTKMGFDFKDLDTVHSVITVISQTRNIEISAAKNQLLSDLEHYYANDHELRKRIRIMESLLKEKEEKFNMLETDYLNEKAILGKAKELISAGLDEQWLKKLQTLIEAYGIDLDLLAEELKQYNSLRATISELQGTKKILEEEERLLRQKVVAYEDQRLRTLSLINQLFVKSIRSSLSPQGPSGSAMQSTDDLTELMRAANGEDIDFEKFRISAQKAIDIIYNKLRINSPARVVLEHARLALKRETKQNES
jgi:chromosome segregation ATPase